MDNQYRNCLFYAIDGGDYQLLSILIAAGANVSQRDSEDQTVISHAISNGDLRFILKLAISGASLAGPFNTTSDQRVLLFSAKLSVEAKALNALEPSLTAKAKSFFQHIDSDSNGSITLEEALQFNMRVQKQKYRLLAEKDAIDFIKSAAIIDGKNVSLDEFIFAFSKLFAENPSLFQKFFSQMEKEELAAAAPTS